MTIALVGVMILGVGMAQQDDARTKALAAAFESMEKGIREKDEAAFKSRWTADGYEKNFVGGSGLSGKAVFGQGTRKKWFLKPDLSSAKVLGDGAAVLVPCQVWAWEKERAVDKVDLLLVRDKDAYAVLGGGEKREQVEALASRFLKKEPLDPPAEKRD